jgi:hypothetical protein
MAFELLPLKPEQHTLTFVPRLSLELPFFNLTFRRKDIPKVIKYAGRDDAGRPMRWEVYQDSSDEIGAPAVEAHEVWYLLVKPSIDSYRRTDGSIPEIIPLGGIRECLRKAGWTAGGFQARELIKALTQIAFAGCVADLWVPTGDKDQEGKEKFLQIKGRFSRMSVYAIGEHHLTEEELAQSKFEFDLEDVLYIRLDPLEAKLQQLQDRRILDNQYLFSLSPAARRWYELMAAKIFGVVNNKGTFCEIRYSWYAQHHHTLKRYTPHKRVRFQMDRVIRDHLESGYIRKAEYRAVKEVDQELDYIIRYYPGPAAGESIDRIQGFIRQRRSARKLNGRPVLHDDNNHRRATDEASETRPDLALSVITDQHIQVIVQLIGRFGIGPTKAYQLALTRMGSAVIQLDVWPLRDVNPRNRAGWMINAIENNYELPRSYVENKEREAEREKLRVVRESIRSCQLCDENGYRRIRSEEYSDGAMHRCTHNPHLERGIAPHAQNGTEQGEKPSREKTTDL